MRLDDVAAQIAIDIDTGFGIAAVAAVAARPKGLARQFEASKWIRRARDHGLNARVYPIRVDASEDEKDAVNELFRASGNTCLVAPILTL